MINKIDDKFTSAKWLREIINLGTAFWSTMDLPSMFTSKGEMCKDHLEVKHRKFGQDPYDADIL